MKRLLIVFLIIGFAGFSHAQKFGKIEPEFVHQKVHVSDSTADAAYIFKKATVRFDFTPSSINLVISHHQRIKIYSEEGEDYANFSIRQRRGGSDRETVSGLKAVAFNEVNGKIKKTELSKKDVYFEETTEDYGYRKFAVPDVRPGTVIDVKYTFTSPHIYTIPRYDLQHDIPVDFVEYEIRIPEFFSYTPIPTGFVNIARSSRDVTGDVGNDVAYNFKAKDVPALKEDDYVLNINDYRSSLTYELLSLRLPDEPTKYYSKDWNQIAKDLMASRYFGKEMKKKVKDLEPFIDGLADLSSEEKITAIYKYVQSEFNWNGYIGYQRHVGYKKLLETKSGSAGDINQLLINLLARAEIAVQPLLLKTRSNGLLNQNFPTVYEFDYVVAYVPIGERFLLLDATDKYVTPGQLPSRAVNINGLLINGNKGVIVPLTNPNKDEVITMSNYELDIEDYCLRGEGKMLYKKYAATKYRSEHGEDDSSDEDVEMELTGEDEEGEDDEYAIENEYEILDIENVDEIGKDIKLSFSEIIREEVKVIGDEIFIDATLDFGIDDNPFFEESRDFPVFYNQLLNRNHVVKISVPEGYEVQSMPDKMRITLEGRKASFNYEASVVGELLVVKYNFKIDSDFFLPSEYDALRRMYDIIVDRSKEKIVLAPIS